jgi:hypothetical protein
MEIQELTARELNAITGAIMIAILVAGVTVGVFAEARFYRRAQKAGMQHG